MGATPRHATPRHTPPPRSSALAAGPGAARAAPWAPRRSVRHTAPPLHQTRTPLTTPLTMVPGVAQLARVHRRGLGAPLLLQRTHQGDHLVQAYRRARAAAVSHEYREQRLYEH